MHYLEYLTKGHIAMDTILLNQAHAGHRPTRAWFLKVDAVQIVSMCVYVCVCVCVCPPPRLLITSGVMWHDIDLI